MKKYKLIVLFFLLLFILISPAHSDNPRSSDHKMSLKKTDIKSALKKVADWQIHNFTYSTSGNLHDYGIDAWTNATLFIGMSQWAKIADDILYNRWLTNIGSENAWKMPANFLKYPKYQLYHADELCVGQFYLAMFDIYADNKMRHHVKERANWIMNNPADSTMYISNKQSWTWCDALFMAPPVYAHLAKIEGDDKYLRFMDKEFKRTFNFLFNKENKLFFRDSSYFDKSEANGEKVFWGRGNGWVAGGLVNILKLLPETSVYRPFYEDLFKVFVARLATLQDCNGFWHASLLDPQSYPSPEISVTALITYALAYGVNSGLLDKEKYQPLIEKSWFALLSAIDENGKLGWTQPIGADPKKVTADMTAPYGVGAFLLAGSELYKLSNSQTQNKENPIDAKFKTLPESVAQTILDRISTDKLNRDRISLELEVDKYLTLWQADGSFVDCHYKSRFRNDEEVLIHLERLREMAIAYTQAENKYYEDEILYTRIVKGFEWWYDQHWTDSNWWQNRVGHPHKLGEALIAMHKGKNKISREPIFDKLIERWKNEMGDTDTPDNPTTAGANKCDIAMHWIYRSCLTLNQADLEKAADRSFLIVENTTGEGIQHDWSYRQHGPQLYIGGYGYEFIQLVTRQAFYLAGTPYAMSADKLEIFSRFVRNTYLKTIRGQRISFSTLGRGMTRTDNTSQLKLVPILNMLKNIDTKHTDEYEAAIKRLKGEEEPSFMMPSSQTHYYRAEYTLQVRPSYTFDVRTASNRMARSEYDINENKQGFFLSDGATNILIDGEEYSSILPFWNWKKIPGTTAPDLVEMRRADNYIFKGRSSYAGGVTNGLYGVTAFDMINDQQLYAYHDDEGVNGVPAAKASRLPALDFGAKKSWFIFDKEIVCLGAGIYSRHDENLFTTINQCRRVGQPIVMANNVKQNPTEGVKRYDNTDWVINDKVGYFFPDKPSVYVANETKMGSWYDINKKAEKKSITGNLFTLWFDHGVKPSETKYAYIVVPNIRCVKEAEAYRISDIEILANNDTVQAVYHKTLNVYGFAFFREGSFHNNRLSVNANAGCLILITDTDKDETKVYVSDPQKQPLPIQLEIKMPLLNKAAAIIYQNPPSPHQGNSQMFKISNNPLK